MLSARSMNEKEWRARLFAGYKQFIAEFQATDILTFNFGTRVGVWDAFYRMKGYCTRIERLALGRNWNRCPDPRLAVVGFPEHLDKNPHWHCVVRAPSVRLHAAVDVESNGIWAKLTPDGQLHHGLPHATLAIKEYFTKEIHLPARIGNVFVYAADNRPKC